jgi:hypothetical protein
MKKFVNVNLHMNNGGCFRNNMKNHKFNSHAFEVTLINKKLITIKS